MLVRDLGLGDSVEFLGLLDAAARARFFARLSVFVLPSFSENFGLVVPEALAAGVPCIASLGTPWGEMVNQRCGWWVENTPESLAEVLRSVMETDGAALGAMGQRGRAWVEDAFGWTSVARRYVDLYTRVAMGGA
jgi:glycosyltransferase involved in cell wall biosynthesis